MAIEKKQIEFAKELDDALLLLIQVVKDAKSGKSPAEIASGSLPAFLAAVQGIDQVDDEMTANPAAFFSTIGYRGGELAAAFLKKAPAAPNEGDLVQEERPLGEPV